MSKIQSIKSFFKILLRKLFKLTLIIGGIALVGFVGVAEYGYRNGLDFLPENSAFNATTHSQNLRLAQWVALGGHGEISDGLMLPTHTILRIGYHLVNKTPPQATAPKDKLTHQAANILLFRKKESLSGGKWHQAKLSAAGWINQNWTITQRLDTVLAESRSGLGCKGIDQLSRALLSKRGEKLGIREAALLVSIQTLPYSYLKRNARILKRVNDLIADLGKEYPKLYGTIHPYKKLPFGTLELGQARRDCRR